MEKTKLKLFFFKICFFLFIGFIILLNVESYNSSSKKVIERHEMKKRGVVPLTTPLHQLNLKTPEDVLEALLHEEKNNNQIRTEIRQMLTRLKSVGGKNKRRKRKKRSADILRKCNRDDQRLLGPLIIDESSIALANISAKNPFVGKGGKFSPNFCTPEQEIAIIVPFRDRWPNLLVWLNNIHPVLQRQARSYRIIVVEQLDPHPFNRAALLNVGAREAEILGSPDCFVFHDVDLLPEDDRNIYECVPGSAIAMSVAASKWKYKLQYEQYSGGVMAVGKRELDLFDGLANSFYGWGGEDDDLYHRLKWSNTSIKRNPAHIARYRMLGHEKAVESPILKNVMSLSERNLLMKEGKSNIKYKMKNLAEDSLFTWIQVELPPPKHKGKKSFFAKAKEKVDSFLGGAIQHIFKQKQEDKYYSGSTSWAKDVDRF